MSKNLRIRHSNKQYLPELLHSLADAVECYRDGNGTCEAKIDGMDHYDLANNALRWAKVMGLGSAVFWFARNVADEPMVPYAFKSLARHGRNSAYWDEA